QEELKMMLALTKPKYFIPVHGEQRHLQRHAELAKSMGVAPRNVVVTETGRVVEIGAKSIKLGARVPCGQILVDGSGVGVATGVGASVITGAGVSIGARVTFTTMPESRSESSCASCSLSCTPARIASTALPLRI
ncbi:MAG: MBL fold metallo-hydrolase RNA specificity domain-containing protein, partial [Eubacteriales bacterium]|nr:MBL fold metallo-hydrolase RNA specificity domain-containing protein [Eubacteriales bacterium]